MRLLLFVLGICVGLLEIVPRLKIIRGARC